METKKKKTTGNWFRFYRPLIKGTIFMSTNPWLTKAWIWCLCKANWKKAKYAFGTEDIILGKGEFVYKTKDAIKEISGITAQRFRTCVKYLEQTRRISRKTTNKCTLIKVLNWRKYQASPTPTNKQLTNKQQTTNKQTTRASFIVKKIKKEKKVKRIYSLYQEKINKRSQLTKQSKIKIKLRLDEYSEAKLLRAIDNFSKDSWWMDNNKHRGLAWFFHSEDRIEQLLNLEPRQQSSGSIDLTKIK
jgi:hypothetical protein